MSSHTIQRVNLQVGSCSPSRPPLFLTPRGTHVGVLPNPVLRDFCYSHSQHKLKQSLSSHDKSFSHLRATNDQAALYCTLVHPLHQIYFIAPTLRDRRKLTATMPNISSRGRNDAPGITVAIILAIIISVTVLAITIMLMVMCHCTNVRRRQEQRETNGVQIELRAIEERVQNRKGSRTEASEKASETSGLDDQDGRASRS